jgi:arginyl-tRNA synthetase
MFILGASLNIAVSTQFFGSLGLLAVGFERYGSEEALAANPIMHLCEIYVAVNNDDKREEESGEQRVTRQRAKEVFRLMEDGTP